MLIEKKNHSNQRLNFCALVFLFHDEKCVQKTDERKSTHNKKKLKMVMHRNTEEKERKKKLLSKKNERKERKMNGKKIRVYSMKTSKISTVQNCDFNCIVLFFLLIFKK